MVSTIIPSLLFICIAKNKGHQYVPVAKFCLVVGCFILLASTWATLNSEKRATTVEKVLFPVTKLTNVQPIPKDSVVNEPALKHLEKLEERVLDTNLNISAKLDDIADLAAKGDQKEAARLIVEMKEQHEQQVCLLQNENENLGKTDKRTRANCGRTEQAYRQTQSGA